MENLNKAIEKFNKMYNEVDTTSSIGKERAHTVVKYGLNLLKQYKRLDGLKNLEDVETKTGNLNDLLYEY